MKIVWAAPPNLVYDQTPHYFQALFSAGGVYLRRRFPHDEVVTEAASFHGAIERVILRHFACTDPAEYLVLWVRPWEAHAALRTAKEVRKIAPDTRILVWGEATSYIPQFFHREPFDLYATNGDPELVVADAIERLQAGLAPIHGVTYKDGTRWVETEVGHTLDPEHWTFPDLHAIDPEIYSYWRKQRGKEADDLSFAVSRGCPINCARWCPTPRKEGLKDRRRSALATVSYMQEIPEPYSVFQMHSPLFSYDPEWVAEFIRLRKASGSVTPFKVVDLMNPYADEAMVADLAEVGMIGLGFGVETLSPSGRRMIPKVEPSLLEKVAANLRKYSVKAKAYIQIGLPGQNREDVLYSLKFLSDLGLKPRPTGSTPFWKLARMSVEELDAADLSHWDRKTYFEPRTGFSYGEFFSIISDPSAYIKARKEAGEWAA
jgi:radical SAM superfamily enzyme YgiQ (UPF0313 family)